MRQKALISTFSIRWDENLRQSWDLVSECYQWLLHPPEEGAVWQECGGHFTAGKFCCFLVQIRRNLRGLFRLEIASGIMWKVKSEECWNTQEEVTSQTVEIYTTDYSQLLFSSWVTLGVLKMKVTSGGPWPWPRWRSQYCRSCPVAPEEAQPGPVCSGLLHFSKIFVQHDFPFFLQLCSLQWEICSILISKRKLESSHYLTMMEISNSLFFCSKQVCTERKTLHKINVSVGCFQLFKQKFSPRIYVVKPAG